MGHDGAMRPRHGHDRGRMVDVNGMVDWQYQKDAAARAVRDLPGVKGVANNIVLQPLLRSIDVEDKIEAA